MYRLYLTESIRQILHRHYQQSPSLGNKLELLESNPLSIAIPTDMPIIGEYYVNAGRFAILFNLGEDNKVSILSIVLRAKLHKILTKRIFIEE